VEQILSPAGRSAVELRALAAEYRRMARDARTLAVAEALLRLAGRCDRLADTREPQPASRPVVTAAT
jgi:hypothetical protein